MAFLCTPRWLLLPLVIFGVNYPGATAAATANQIEPKLPLSDLMWAVQARPEARNEKGRVSFTLVDANGREQLRTAHILRVDTGEQRRSALYFDSPRALRDAAFLIWDEHDASLDDSNWLYLPTLRRVRRIPSRDRGQSFLGTDLSYDDIRHPAKADLVDWTLDGSEIRDEGILVKAHARNEEVINALGYSRAEWLVDADIAFIRESTYWDAQGEILKTVRYLDLSRTSENTWRADRIEVHNHKTGSQTIMRFADMVSDADIDPELLHSTRLSRGAP